jgi:hypothetical protein
MTRTGIRRRRKRQIQGNGTNEPRQDCCSRFCNGQNTKEPQSSTGLGEETVTYSIETTYFHSVSTDFHKRCDLLWDRWSHLPNLRRLKGIQRGPLGRVLDFAVLREYQPWDSAGASVGVFPSSLSDLFGHRSLTISRRLDSDSLEVTPQIFSMLHNLLHHERIPASAGRVFQWQVRQALRESPEVAVPAFLMFCFLALLAARRCAPTSIPRR